MPPSPMRSSSVSTTASNETSYWVSEAMEYCWRKVTPTAVGSTRKRSIASSSSPVRASTTSRSAAAAKVTWRFRPLSRKPPAPSGSARTWTPRGENPFSGSNQAGVRMDSPEAMPPSHCDFMPVLPAWAITPPESTALAKCGVGANARPNSS